MKLKDMIYINCKRCRATNGYDYSPKVKTTDGRVSYNKQRAKKLKQLKSKLTTLERIRAKKWKARLSREYIDNILTSRRLSQRIRDTPPRKHTRYITCKLCHKPIYISRG